MGEVLFELEQILRSNQAKLTSQEANVLMQCKAKALREFTLGAGVGGGVVWLATRKLSNLFRINLAGGAAALSGLWRFGQALDSCVQHILGLDGSRMQRELANIMLKKYPNDPMITKLISKHFYCENVFDDSTPGTPKLRWRFRNFFVENAAHSQRPHDGDSYNDDIDLKPKQVSMNSGFVAMANPFDCVFGTPAGVEEINRPVSLSTSLRRHSRKHKRSQRRRRMHNQEVHASSDT